MAISTISAFSGESRNVTTHRQDAGEVGADDRQELADDADPQRRGRPAPLVPTDWNTIQWKIADSSASSARE